MTNIDHWLSAITLLSALGCGLIAGVFFAFSSFVMKALARLAPGQGIAAMQSINLVVLNRAFLGAFLGTAAGCAVVVFGSLLRWGRLGAVYLFVGGMAYLVGTFLVTMMFNAPKNDALALVRSDDPQSAAVWTHYVAVWTAWNHVRTAAAFAAAVALSLALAF